jgi:hypothetical protein
LVESISYWQTRDNPGQKMKPIIASTSNTMIFIGRQSDLCPIVPQASHSNLGSLTMLYRSG